MHDRLKRLLAGTAVLGAAVAGGAAIGNAASSNSTTATTITPTGTPPAAQSFPAHGTAAHEDAEKPVTGDAAGKAKAAAIKIVGSGTAGEVTTDFSGNGYEVTVTKSDGSSVEIHLDGSFTAQGPGGYGHG
jgi:hypothetical protein